MKNKFISKLQIVWNGIKSIFGKIKKSFGNFLCSIRITFEVQKNRMKRKADEKKQHKKQEKKIAMQNETDDYAKVSEDFEVSKDIGTKTDAQSERSEIEKECYKNAELIFPKSGEKVSGNVANEKGIYITPKKTWRATLHFLDFVASLIFISAVVVCLKPSLLSKWILDSDVLESGFFKVAEWIGQSFLDVNILDEYYSADFLSLRNMIVTIALSAYVLIKLIIIFLCKDSNKLVSLLLLILFVLICFIAGSKFLLLIIFTVVLYLTFQIACFLPTKAILRKFLWIAIFTAIGYFVAHLILYPGFTDKLGAVFKALRLSNVQMW